MLQGKHYTEILLQPYFLHIHKSPFFIFPYRFSYNLFSEQKNNLLQGKEIAELKMAWLLNVDPDGDFRNPLTGFRSTLLILNVLQYLLITSLPQCMP